MTAGLLCDVLWSDIKFISETYKHDKSWKGYFTEYCNYVMSGEVDCIILQKDSENYNEIHELKHTIREKYGVRGFQDLLHTSDNNEDAEHEIVAIFGLQ